VEKQKVLVSRRSNFVVGRHWWARPVGAFVVVGRLGAMGTSDYGLTSLSSVTRRLRGSSAIPLGLNSGLTLVAR
jgi:hypothetical protein